MSEPQSWDELLEELEELDWMPELQTADGTLFMARESYEFVWQDEEWYFEAPPDGITVSTLLNLQWDTGPGLTWEGSIQLVQREQGPGYVGFYVEDNDETPTSFLAQVTPGDSAPIYREIVTRILRGDFSEEPLVNLPDALINGRPDLLDEGTVRASVRAQLDRESARRGDAWTQLAQTLNHDVGVTRDSDLDDGGKEALLDGYFEQSYAEGQG